MKSPYPPAFEGEPPSPMPPDYPGDQGDEPDSPFLITAVEVIPGDTTKPAHDCLENLKHVTGGLACTFCGAQYVPQHGSQLKFVESAVDRAARRALAGNRVIQRIDARAR